jgi:hypothetical protein
MKKYAIFIIFSFKIHLKSKFRILEKISLERNNGKFFYSDCIIGDISDFWMNIHD